MEEQAPVHQRSVTYWLSYRPGSGEELPAFVQRCRTIFGEGHKLFGNVVITKEGETRYDVLIVFHQRVQVRKVARLGRVSGEEQSRLVWLQWPRSRESPVAFVSRWARHIRDDPRRRDRIGDQSASEQVLSQARERRAAREKGRRRTRGCAAREASLTHPSPPWKAIVFPVRDPGGLGTVALPAQHSSGKPVAAIRSVA